MKQICNFTTFDYSKTLKILFCGDDTKLWICLHDDKTQLRDLKTGQILKSLNTDFANLFSLNIRENLLVHVKQNEEICVFDLEKESSIITFRPADFCKDEKTKLILEKDEQNNECITISTDARFVVTASASGKVVLCDLHLKNVHILEGHTEIVYWVTFSKNNLFATGSCDGSVCLWNAITRECVKYFKTSVEDYHAVYSIDFSNDDSLIAVGDSDYNVTICDIHSGVLLKRIHFNSSMLCLRFSPIDNDIIAIPFQRNDSVCLWNFKLDKLVRKFTHYAGYIYDIRFSPNGRKLAICGHGVYIWQIDEIELITKIVAILRQKTVSSLVILNIINFILAAENSIDFETESEFMYKQKMITICDVVEFAQTTA